MPQIDRTRGALAARTHALDAALAIGFVVLWSSGFIGAELGTKVAAAVTVLTWRFVAATVLLALWRICRRPAGLPIREVAAQAGIGLLTQSGYLLGTVGGIQLGVPAGTAALVAALQPLLSGVLARPVLGERVSRRQRLGLAVGLAGVVLVVAGDLSAPAGTPAWAYALPFGGMAALVAGTLLERRLALPTGVVDGLTVQTGASAVVFVAVAAGTGTLLPPADLSFWVAVAWTVLLSHLGGYGLYWLNVRRGSVTRVGVLLYATPPATALWAALMFGEPFGLSTVLGMLLCASSMLLVYLRPRRRRPHPAAKTLTPCGSVSGGT